MPARRSTGRSVERSHHGGAPVEENAGKGKEWPSSAEPVSSLASPPDRRPVHQERGEGIGLSIVKRLCELLDASVELESKPGEGTTFRVVLPRRYDATEPKE